MTAQPLELLRDPDRLRAALSPIRRQLLERLKTPGSASTLASELGVSRQRLGYHLKALEDAGLLTMVETRQRRGFTERFLVACAQTLLVDPSVMGARTQVAPDLQDRFAADHLITAAAGLVADVGRMQADAEAEGTRLLTFTLEAEITLGRPADLKRYAEALAEALAAVTAQFNAKTGRRFRVVAGAHPTPFTKLNKDPA